MAITREKKQQILEKVKAIGSSAKSIVFVHFKGFKVADTNALRRELRQHGVGYTVAKKSLVRRALGESGISGEMPELDGEIAVAYLKEGVEDTILPARKIHEFAKKFKENLAIVGGVFEGKFLGRDDMVVIATIPSIDVLRGQFVNLINSPIQGFVMALSQIAEKKEN